MHFLETLKEFKKIQANPDFTERSRRTVLASLQKQPVTLRQVLFRTFEAAGSLALAGVLLFALVGGFSGLSKYLSPISFSGIDPSALHAEADAIDMQIKLANLTYPETTSTIGSTIITPSGTAKISIKTNTPVAPESPAATSTDASSSVPSIDDALQALTK